MVKMFEFCALRPLMFAACVGAFLFTSCGPIPQSETTLKSAAMQAYESYNRPATLPTNPSKVRVKVSLKNQMAYVMEGSKPLLVMPVTVGPVSYTHLTLPTI